MLRPQQTLSCYKTERPLSCEQKEKQTDKISPTSKVYQGATKMAGLLLAFSAALFLAASANPTTYEQEGHLRILNAENNVLEAVFFTGATGIRIYGDDSSIAISSLSDGEELIAGSAGDSSKLYRVVGSNFFQETTTDENGELRKVKFVLPESLVNQAKEDIQTRKQQRITSRLTEQSETEVQTAQQQAFQRLFLRQEIQLIEPAAKALGRVGVIGYENQGALNFYGVAIAITKYQHQGESGDGSGDEGNGMVNRRYRRYLTQRNKRWWGLSWCSYSWSYCVTGTCRRGSPSCHDKCTDWNNCLGRCGPGCWWCWRYVCGSCCYRQGCYDHDVCCGIHGYFSTECLVPLPFSCTGGYSC